MHANCTKHIFLTSPDSTMFQTPIAIQPSAIYYTLIISLCNILVVMVILVLFILSFQSNHVYSQLSLKQPPLVQGKVVA